MKRCAREILLALAVTTISTAAFAQGTPAADPPEPVGALAHLERARQLGGADLKNVAEGYVCMPPAAANTWIRAVRARKAVLEPFQAFDNLYYIGMEPVGVWLLKTSDGIVMFDALNNEDEARNIIVPGMRKLGLDPASVKLIIASHSHGEHYGGAKYFHDTYQTRVVSSALEWDEMEKNSARLPIPPRDVITDGQRLTVGDATVTLLITPGHTPGTVSTVFPVKENGVTRYMTILGGTRMLLNSAAVGQNHDSVHRLWAAGSAAGAIGAISTHAWSVDSFELMKRPPAGSASPLNLGREGYERLMGVYDECVMAMGMRFQAWGQ